MGSPAAPPGRLRRPPGRLRPPHWLRRRPHMRVRRRHGPRDPPAGSDPTVDPMDGSAPWAAPPRCRGRSTALHGPPHGHLGGAPPWQVGRWLEVPHRAPCPDPERTSQGVDIVRTMAAPSRAGPNFFWARRQPGGAGASNKRKTAIMQGMHRFEVHRWRNTKTKLVRVGLHTEAEHEPRRAKRAHVIHQLPGSRREVVKTCEH